MRKCRIFRKISDTKGFTLAEILLAVAILIVLSAIGTISAMTMIKNSRQRSADDAAETIAMAFQNRLQEIYAFEYDSREILEAGSLDLSDGFYALGASNGKVTVGSPDSAKAQAALDKLTDNGNVLSSDLYKNEFVLVYDPVNCRVLYVTYSSDNSNHPISGIYSSDTVSDSASRKSNYGGTVGYYKIDEKTASDIEMMLSDTRQNINVRIGHYVNGERRLHNYDELIAYIEVKFPTEGKALEDRLQGKYVRLDVKIQGKTSENIVTYSLWGSYNSSISELKFPIILDGFKQDKDATEANLDKENNRFYNQFCDGTVNASSEVFSLLPAGVSLPGNKGVNTDKDGVEGSYPLLAGEDIDVTVTVSSFKKLDTEGKTKEDPLLTVSATATDNSLFAYDNGVPETKQNNKNVKSGFTQDKSSYNAFIEYGRHLQNLDESSGISKISGEGGIEATVINAVQIQDIDFNAAILGAKNLPVIGEPIKDVDVLWHKLYVFGAAPGTSRFFTPIINSSIKTYSGEGPDKTGVQKQYTIKNLVIDETAIYKSALLGRTYFKDNAGKYEEKNYYAGLFRIFEGTKLSNIVLIDPKIMGLQKTDVDAEGNIGNASSVGALAGYVKNSTKVEITDCKVQITGEVDKEDGSKEPTGWIKTGQEQAP